MEFIYEPCGLPPFNPQGLIVIVNHIQLGLINRKGAGQVREKIEFENYIIEYSLELEFAEKYWRDYHIGNFELKIYSIRENVCYDKIEFKDFLEKFGVYRDGVFDIFNDCFVLCSKLFGEGLSGESSYELGKKILKIVIENELSRKRIFFDGDFKFSVKA